MIRKLITYLSVLLLLFATGCRSDEPSLPPKGDGQTSLKLLIPSTSMARSTGQTRGAEIATRAHASTADLATGEGAISYFHLVGFYTDKNGDKRHFYQKLTPEMGEAVDGIYRSYSFYVEPANYRLYMIANFEPTAVMADLPKEDEDIDVEQLELDVKALTQTYNASNLPQLNLLPMSAYKEVTVQEKTTATAELALKFLCAKVRITVVHEDLGKKGLYVDALKASNVYQKVNAFATSNATDKFDIDADCAAVKGHFEVSNEIKGKTAAQLAVIPTNDLQDPLETLTEEITNPANCGDYAYQGVVYLPASEASSYATNPTTLSAVLSDGTTAIPFKVGCNAAGNSDHDSKNPSLSKLESGHFYDLVARIIGGDIEFSWKEVAWDPKTITIKLAGGSDLYIAKTEIPSASEVGVKINGSEAYRIPYSTQSVPALSFESDKFNGKDIFDLRENKDEGVIEVSLSSNVGIGTTLPSDIGFWVIAGSIRKYVKVLATDTEAYVRITPKSRNLYISQIVNSASYDLWYEYSTNMSSLTLQLKDYVNNNSRRGMASGNAGGMKIAIYTGTEAEYEIYSAEVPLSNNLNLHALAKAAGITDEFPTTGVIRITLTDPSDQQAFGQRISGTLLATGSHPDLPNKTAQATFNIEPNPSKYIIHFKGTDGTNTWAAPHIYVYQPLMFNGYEVFDTQGGVNWLEYSFTGKLVFKGWKSQMGEIDDLTTQPFGFYQKAGIWVTAYRAWDGYADKADVITGNGKYYTTIDLIENHHNDLPTSSCCKTATNPIWPGVEMIAEVIPETEGWWRIELPLLAQPGKALIMFANGHDGGSKSGIHNGIISDNVFNSNDTHRHPTDGNPGIVLPNYSDCEAWFLYDTRVNRDDLAFSDDRRESYGSSGQTDPDPGEETKTVTVSFRAPLKSTDTKITEQLYIWNKSDKNIGPAWPGEVSDKVKDGYVYWTYTMTIPESQTPSEVIDGFKFVASADTDNITWSGHNAEVTDASVKAGYGNCDYLYTIWAGSSEPLPNTYVEPQGTHYVISWPDGWGNKIYMWNGDNKPLGNHNSDGNKEKYKDGGYYWNWVDKSNFINSSLSLGDGYNFLNVNNDGTNSGNNTPFNDEKVSIISEEDIPSAVKSKMNDSGVTVIKVFRIKYKNN